jgi:hypothetical protein
MARHLPVSENARRPPPPACAGPQCDDSPGPKATPSHPKGDGFGRQSDTLAAKATLFIRKVTEKAGFRLGQCHTCQHPPIAAALLALVALLLAAPVAARDSLGVFGDWGAFRDPRVPRCYAIAAAQNARSGQPLRQGSGQAYASIGTWPRRQVRGQVHMRLSRAVAPSATISLGIGGQRFELTGGGGDAWARDRRMDAAIVAAMRSAGSMSVSTRDTSGRRFTDRYSLEGAATAMDAATVGCSRIR